MNDDTAGKLLAIASQPTKIGPGSDQHLTLIGSRWHLNLLGEQDRADMLAFGHAVWRAAEMHARAARARELRAENAALQARIDALMLEHCPREMAHQRRRADTAKEPQR